MPNNNTINNASKYERELIEVFIDNSYIAPFVALDTKFIDGKNFHFTAMSTSGYKAHSLNGGWNRGKVVETDKVYTLTMDRDVEFFVDKREVDESNQTATIQNISDNFERLNATPEKDAYFFSKVAQEAIRANKATATQLASYTAANVYSKVVDFIGKLRRYRNKGLIVYARPEIMDLLAKSTELSHSMDVLSIVQDGKAIETRITKVNGVPIVEVIDDDRFYNEFDFDGEAGGYEPASGAAKINLLGATPLTTKMVPKIESIYFFAPGQHTQGDGYLYQNRAHYDTFVFPNGKDASVDSVAVDLDTSAVPSL
jgi:hypothetical protein